MGFGSADSTGHVSCIPPHQYQPRSLMDHICACDRGGSRDSDIPAMGLPLDADIRELVLCFTRVQEWTSNHLWQKYPYHIKWRPLDYLDCITITLLFFSDYRNSLAYPE